MRLRTAAVISVAVLALTACGGGDAGGMPTGEHVHSLGVTADGGLMLGLHGGLYRSDDGEGWALAGLTGEDAMVIATAGVGNRMFVAGHEVLYRSDDDGETFTPLTPPDLPGMDIHGFAQAQSDPHVVYAFVVGHGLFASGDGGDTWEPRASIDAIPRDVFGIAVVGNGDETVMMMGPESGVHRSTDGGRSFQSVLETPSGAVAVDETSPDLVWVLTAAGLARSDDAGVTWEIASTMEGVAGQPVAIASDGNLLWVVTEEPRSLYRSDDSGVSWQLVSGT